MTLTNPEMLPSKLNRVELRDIEINDILHFTISNGDIVKTLDFITKELPGEEYKYPVGKLVRTTEGDDGVSSGLDYVLFGSAHLEDGKAVPYDDTAVIVGDYIWGEVFRDPHSLILGYPDLVVTEIVHEKPIAAVASQE